MDIIVVECFVAGETLSGIIYSPSNKQDMISNITRVINFMTERNIRMHVTHAEGKLVLLLNVAMTHVNRVLSHAKVRNNTVLVYFPTQFHPACRCVCQKVLKSFGTAEFTSELKNAFYCLNTANLVLQMPNTGKRQNVKKCIHRYAQHRHKH